MRPLPVICLLTMIVTAGCGGGSLNPEKFETVNATAKALQADVMASGGLGSAQFPELLKQFQTEIAVVREHANGSRETTVVRAYEDAAESYAYFLRFNNLDREAVGGMVLLTGPNRPIAGRYDVPMESRGGGRWVNRRQAMAIFLNHAESAQATAQRLLSGG